MLPVIRRRTSPSFWDNGRELDRWFNTAFGFAPSLSGWSPPVDVQESSDAFVVTVELPGITAEQVDVNVENGVLSISGEKREQFEEGDEGSSQHVVERRYGRFSRNFAVPRSVNPDGVKAGFENGVLTVTLPKAAEAKPRKIKIAS